MQFDQLKRRDFITLLGGAAAAWPLAAHAQQTAIPVVGVLSSGTIPADLIRALHQGLNELGLVEKKDFAFEHRQAGGVYDRFQALAADLTDRQVSAILAPGGVPAARAAKAVTTTIPIVFLISGDPIAHGLVTSLNRPGGNLTGLTFLGITLGAKRIELLGDLLPNAISVGMLVNPKNPDVETDTRDIRAAARALGKDIRILSASSEADFDSVFATLARDRTSTLVVGSDPFFGNARHQLVALAERYAVPAIYDRRDFALAGGLISYGHDRFDAYRQLGQYIGRILKGEKPADLPVLQPTKFELVINLKTARALRLDVPDKLLALADEVIE
jgi:putative ABC transport system substrate-binding protein